jgi:hypothetical protein
MRCPGAARARCRCSRRHRAASLCLLLLALGVRAARWRCGASVLAARPRWCFRIRCSRALPEGNGGARQHALNVFVFIGMFSGQWAVGIVLNQWPQTPTGYSPQAYPWALGMVWFVQFAGLAWLWAGRRSLA